MAEDDKQQQARKFQNVLEIHMALFLSESLVLFIVHPNLIMKTISFCHLAIQIH